MVLRGGVVVFHDDGHRLQDEGNEVVRGAEGEGGGREGGREGGVGGEGVGPVEGGREGGREGEGEEERGQ